MVGTGKGAENGILIKSGEALETAHEINAVVVDKTGTLTEGKPFVTNIVTFDFDADELLKIAAGLENKSEHPLAKAITNYAAENNISAYEVQNFKAVFGKGVQSEINGVKYFAGNEKFLAETGFNLSNISEKISALAAEGKTPILIGKRQQATGNSKLIGVIAVADIEKSTSKFAVDAFKNLGVEVIMLTGDNKFTAKNIADKLGIKNFVAEVLPEDNAS